MPPIHIYFVAVLGSSLTFSALSADGDGPACGASCASAILAADHLNSAGAVGLLQTEVVRWPERRQNGTASAVDSKGEVAALLMALAEAEMDDERASANTTTTAKTMLNATLDEAEALKAMGLSYNSAGDLDAYFNALVSTLLTCVAVVAIFSVLRVRTPIKYSANVLKGAAPSSPDVTRLFSWFEASHSASLEQIAESSGLDQAMLIEFSNLAMRICTVVGLPILCVTGPLNFLFGGHFAGSDRMSYVGLGNVHPGNVLYWGTGLVVWFTVLVVTRLLFEAQERYMVLRWAWCRHMAPIRANTVLVEGVPDECQSDSELMKFFQVLFPGDRIKSTYVVKDTTELCRLKAKLEDAEHSLVVAKAVREQTPNTPQQIRKRLCGALVDAIEYWETVVSELKPEAEALRKAMNEEITKGAVGGHNCASGFVTFYERSDAELAVRLSDISSDQLEWRIQHPPEPRDVLWVDLMQDPTAEAGRHVLGYALIAGLYFAYIPLVVGITNLAKLIDMGPLQPLWSGVAPTLGLMLMVSFLPTFLLAIFKVFFTIRAEAWLQSRLQEWYFWFQLVFVVMATAVSQDVADFTKTLVEKPMEIFAVLAQSMPHATHFYIGYVTIDWATHCTNLMRHTQLSKYTFLSKFYDQETADKMSEPEDQDYFGLGSRSARWTTMLVIGIVFGTLSPSIWVVVFIDFAIIRIVYGYLIPFTETRKADLGGVFWTTQLKHVFYGMMLYCALMTGVLSVRAPHPAAALSGGSALVYTWFAQQRFQSRFSSENLPFHELMSDAAKEIHAKLPKRHLDAEYIQLELTEEIL